MEGRPTSFRPVRRLSITTRTCSTSITTFLPYTWFTPYVQAGIGVTNMEYKFTYDTGKDSYKEHNFTGYSAAVFRPR